MAIIKLNGRQLKPDFERFFIWEALLSYTRDLNLLFKKRVDEKIIIPFPRDDSRYLFLDICEKINNLGIRYNPNELKESFKGLAFVTLDEGRKLLIIESACAICGHSLGQPPAACLFKPQHSCTFKK
jgi:hypothetical protein